MKIIIIANRLPVKIQREEEGFCIVRSEGGLATGLGSLETDTEIFWVGWPGIHTEDENEKQEIIWKLHEMNFHPVFLSADQIENYYEGYSNSTIWPLCHYFFSYMEYRAEYWGAYQEVNRLFCWEAIPFIEKEDMVWVQDYQLMLLPKMIRTEKPDTNIGYFHHIPFPSYELFRVLPEREAVLEGLLGADLIGFHTHDYMRHFISAIYRVLDLNCTLDEINLQDRTVHVDAFPMGINYEQFHNAPTLPEVREKSEMLREELGDTTVILSVDRLDYSKGILHRLQGFKQFLEHNPEYHKKVSLAMIVVPSRDNVDIYADLKTKIDQTIGEINGQYSRLGWTPIYYFYRSFSFEELVAMYNIAEIALVTPLRDGMNLVAKEYLACKGENNGVLILSEMAGAAIELQDAITINPNDAVEIEQAIVDALTMPEAEKKERLHKMQERISTQDVKKWAKDFVKELQSIKAQNKEILQKVVGKRQLNQIKGAYDDAAFRLLLLDYDGTLAPFVKRPEDAIPSPQLLDLLQKMTSDKKNKVVINSGRNRQVLDQWFRGLDLDFAAEHGTFYKENGRWHENMQKKVEWDDEIIDILQHTIDKTPRSHLERKDTSLVWHYRKVDVWLAELRTQQLVNALIGPCSRLNLQIVPGNKIVEIKSPDFNKGSEVLRRLAQKDYDFVLAIGDDTTDEDMFRVLPPGGISIKVGNFSPTAKYRIPLQSSVITFLSNLIK
ncbi:MAG: bifunctional alpha,alpha-trehalose-phosphate synthase (UDP-forming)/trehalose-phosphatase [Proteiniphilum sp.]|uniref:bifunctional alpha,alpha-trehalose-phosphate synthase (UDP-forming)/trehalose-phosphatase n=1 Tax=Proteiniphilum sp. TaxID=1926877 RepID=UPI002B2171AE|nr:bifunctional alpha,alpha-trehalose-phosphate synthase (UDP-forming)/trehalose-phosphatase [Proteiniphilum sp.]MEA5129965.1 bifunctional alpha,alpha-trehalose-phosphate synthase (UDP-forming)/trehalose-phosphatase [Proteiniphilum sp.]